MKRKRKGRKNKTAEKKKEGKTKEKLLYEKQRKIEGRKKKKV